MTNRYILYGRVSSEKQRDNTSLEGQFKRIVAYCKKEKIPVEPNEDIIREIGSSSGKEERPEFGRALFKMQSSYYDGMIVVDIDRFFRSTELGLACYRQWFEEGCGGPKRLISLQQNIDTSTPEGWWMFVQFLAMGEYASRKDVRRMRQGYDAAKAKEPDKFMGGQLGYGQAVGPNGLKIEVDDPVLNFIKLGMAKNWNVSTITTQLNYSDLKPKIGKKFYKSTISAVVERLSQ